MWRKGPLPPGTYMWGGAVPVDEETGYGFYFADFAGDHVVLVGTGKDGAPDRVLKAHEVAWYNNALDLPPGKTGRLGSPPK